MYHIKRGRCLQHSMLFTITTTHTSATDLGFLLHKHLAKHQTFAQPFGQTHVFYSEATLERLPKCELDLSCGESELLRLLWRASRDAQ